MVRLGPCKARLLSPVPKACLRVPGTVDRLPVVTDTRGEVGATGVPVQCTKKQSKRKGNPGV